MEYGYGKGAREFCGPGKEGPTPPAFKLPLPTQNSLPGGKNASTPRRHEVAKETGMAKNNLQPTRRRNTPKARKGATTRRSIVPRYRLLSSQPSNERERRRKTNSSPAMGPRATEERADNDMSTPRCS